MADLGESTFEGRGISLRQVAVVLIFFITTKIMGVTKRMAELMRQAPA